MPWRTTAGGSWRERLQEGPGLCGSRMWFLLRAGGPASLEHCLLLVSLFFLGQTCFPCPISLQRGDIEPEALLSGGPRVTATVASSPAVQTARCPMQWKPLQQEGRATPGLPRCLSLRARSPVVLCPVSANTRSTCLFLFLVAGGGKARPALTLRCGRKRD